MLKRFVLALPAIFCWGCATPLTQQGSTVQIGDENIVRQCQYLGDVTAAAVRGSEGYPIDADGTYRTGMRNIAGTMRATHVVFVSESLAHAYRCPTPAATAPAGGANSDHVAKVRAREQAAGAAADHLPASEAGAAPSQ
jgi:hypothetical protein